MQGVEGQIFTPWREPMGYPRRRIAVDIHDHAGIDVIFCCPSTWGTRRHRGADVAGIYVPVLRWSLDPSQDMMVIAAVFLVATGLLRLGSAVSSCALEEGNL